MLLKEFLINVPLFSVYHWEMFIILWTDWPKPFSELQLRDVSTWIWYTYLWNLKPAFECRIYLHLVQFPGLKKIMSSTSMTSSRQFNVIVLYSFLYFPFEISTIKWLFIFLDLLLLFWRFWKVFMRSFRNQYKSLEAKLILHLMQYPCLMQF